MSRALAFIGICRKNGCVGAGPQAADEPRGDNADTNADLEICAPAGKCADFTAKNRPTASSPVLVNQHR